MVNGVLKVWVPQNPEVSLENVLEANVSQAQREMQLSPQAAQHMMFAAGGGVQPSRGGAAAVGGPVSVDADFDSLMTIPSQQTMASPGPGEKGQHVQNECNMGAGSEGEGLPPRAMSPTASDASSVHGKQCKAGTVLGKDSSRRSEVSRSPPPSMSRDDGRAPGKRPRKESLRECVLGEHEPDYVSSGENDISYNAYEALTRSNRIQPKSSKN